jgi:hypothetical protein
MGSEARLGVSDTTDAASGSAVISSICESLHFSCFGVAHPPSHLPSLTVQPG